MYINIYKPKSVASKWIMNKYNFSTIQVIGTIIETFDNSVRPTTIYAGAEIMLTTKY